MVDTVLEDATIIDAVARRTNTAPVESVGPKGLALTVRDVSHGFTLRGENLRVLDHVDFTVEAGEFIALLGPSGCGKSTLLRLVAGLEQPLTGSIETGKGPILGPDPSRILVFQDPTLFPWRKVYDNIALGLEARGLLRQNRERVTDVLRLVGLQNFANAYPHQLSGGMAQRVSLARALVNDPSLLLLDEPLGKLDALTRLSMQGEIVRLWRQAGFTALLVTHDIEEALLMATRVIVFSDRPARIKADIRVDKPYPRHRDDPELVARRHEILGLLGYEADW
ncbi:ABC transporter ATP-binding protein [Beijerinckia indica]|uniref:ABC transporter related n=1 Tax=Beijerinckia indica subsp. indica (strain ATCC 9039 / DSM 1715 / NCIMB 8712) TaxID=395963 RepID=B2IFB4_BEII9|nr:ABC transporter ATP-binding protein [Beijerinckia indica]ACB95679.1 ABC transporter related [Beijerinckia indica subsp. indica ATCC 9039]